MTGLDNAGMDWSDRQLVNVLSFDGKESVLLGWPSVVSLRGKRGMHAPFPVIEPGARIRQADRNKCEQIGDSTLQPDRRWMYSSYRRIAAIGARDAQHQDAAQVIGIRDGHMNSPWLAPKPEQGQRTTAQPICRFRPDIGLHLYSGPRAMLGNDAPVQTVERIRPGWIARRHLSRPATF
jgi:hypothetical protein